MDADRRERARSIRAAREWLTGAEHALAGEDDLAGDLKLMLARAELARIAADRRARMRRYARWLLPPLVGAAVLAWAVWDTPSEEPSAVPPAQHAAQYAVSAPAAQTGERTPAPPSLPAETAAPAETLETTAEQVQEAEAVRADPQPVPVQRDAPVRDTAPVQRPQVPDADLQHLMQVGGKILRE